MKKKIVALVLCGLLAASLSACSNNNHNNNSASSKLISPNATEVPEKLDELGELEDHEESPSVSSSAPANENFESQISIQALPDEDGHVAVFITNNSNTIIDELEAQILFKDASGATVDMDDDGHDMVLPGSTVVSQMDAPDSYDHFETSFTAEVGTNPSYENHAADVQINANQGEDCIIIEITNNGTVDIEEIEYIVLLYKGDNLVSVGYSSDVYDLKAGQTVTEKENTYSADYDRFEVYLNQAHTFGL